MAAVPIFVWNGTAWQETGPTIPANPIKYQASAPTSPSTGDIWVDSDGDVTTGSQQFQRFRFVASGGETTISGADANGAVLAYTAGLEQVVLNGAVLVRGHDYLATTGTTITGLSPALVASDVLEVFSFIAFTVANTYTQAQVDGLLDSYVGLRLITPTSATNGTVGATGAVTFSGVSSVSLNGCFTSTYQNYQILLDISSGTGDNVDLSFKYRLSGTDTSTNYQYQRYYFTGSTLTTGQNELGTDEMFLGALDKDNFSGRSTYEIKLFGPQTATLTSNISSGYGSFGALISTYGCTGWQNSATQFDGITFIPSAGNFTGTVRVYGYKN